MVVPYEQTSAHTDPYNSAHMDVDRTRPERRHTSSDKYGRNAAAQDGREGEGTSVPSKRGRADGDVSDSPTTGAPSSVLLCIVRAWSITAVLGRGY
jgi:hypothetical protein